jgi:hypothetical protein
MSCTNFVYAASSFLHTHRTCKMLQKRPFRTPIHKWHYYSLFQTAIIQHATRHGIGDKGQEIPQQLMYRRSGRHFEHVSDICLFHWWSFFLVKIKTSGLRTTLSKCWIIRISELSDIGLKAFCCISIIKNTNVHYPGKLYVRSQKY